MHKIKNPTKPRTETLFPPIFLEKPHKNPTFYGLQLAAIRHSLLSMDAESLGRACCLGTTGARARTHTHTCLTVALPPQPAPFLSVAARSMRGSPGGACAGTRTAAKPTADQIRVLGILKQLAEADTNTNTNTNTNNNNNLHPDGHPGQNSNGDMVCCF